MPFSSPMKTLIQRFINVFKCNTKRLKLCKLVLLIDKKKYRAKC